MMKRNESRPAWLKDIVAAATERVPPFCTLQTASPHVNRENPVAEALFH
jgi:hypothetical protein